ncbi:MAG: hypothetical protein PHE89_03900 [Alphaproteobacteria bacterium]|nr:hypothetical protein [Alphaproteobacteria bacterium]
MKLELFKQVMKNIEELSKNLKKEDKSKRYINRCYDFLSKDLGVIRTRYELSKTLNKNKYYIGMVICKDRPAPVKCIGSLVKKLEELSKEHKDIEITNLITEGKDLINQMIIT